MMPAPAIGVSPPLALSPVANDDDHDGREEERRPPPTLPILTYEPHSRQIFVSPFRHALAMAGPIHRSLAVGQIARLSTRTRLHPRDRVSVTTDAAMSQSQRSSVQKDVIVVGNGPIGSAVARHVAEGGHSVLVVDGGKRLTSASDDMGRIVRPLDAEGRQRWTAWNVESIEAFHDMETRSGIEFFTRCGSLACGTESFVERPAQLLAQNGVPHVSLSSGHEVAARFPCLSVPDTHVAVCDDVGGYVDPGAMIRAQNALMASSGSMCDVVTATATRVDVDVDVDESTRHVRVTAEDGSTFVSSVAVLAGGAYTTWLAATSGLATVGAPGDLVDRGEVTGASPDASSGLGSVRASRRTVLLAEVTEATAKGALGSMPTVKYQFAPPPGDADAPAGSSSQSRNEAMSVYVLPPIWYPDGVLGLDPGWYVKIGGGANDFFNRDRVETHAVADLHEWMRSDGDESVADRLHDVLVALMPDTNFLSVQSKPCVTTCSDDGELQVEALGAGGAVLAVTGCQGKAAGPADAIGRAVASEVVAKLGARET